MEPLSVAASIVGVAVPALHATRLLLDDIKGISDAPKVVQDLKEDLLSVDTALKSLQAINASEWTSLGGTVANDSETAVETCEKACNRFRADISALEEAL